MIDDPRVLILRGDYDPDFFTAGELATAAAFKLEKRRREWLLSRFAAKSLALRMGLAGDPRTCDVARPALIVDGSPTSWFVSLSHSEPFAAAALAREPVGIDVQVVRELPERSAHLFLSPEEIEAMECCTLPERLLHFWCAKEAAWKQRSDEYATLRQLPLTFLEESTSSLSFASVKTQRVGELIVAVTV